MTIQFVDSQDPIVNCGSDTSLDNLSLKTITAWIFLDSFGDGNQGYILVKTAAGGEDAGWGLAVRGASGPSPRETLRFFQGWSTSNGEWRAPNQGLATGQWYHVAVTYDRGSTANDAVLYIDGVSVTVTETSAPLGTVDDDSASSVTIGNLVNIFRDFDGRMTDLRIYDRLLSADEIATIHAARGVDGIVNGLVFRHMLDEDAPGVVASGTDLNKDLSDSGNDGTPSGTGGPTFAEGVIRSRRRVS